MRLLVIMGAALLAAGLLGGVAYAWTRPAPAVSSSMVLHLALEDGQLTVVDARRLDTPVRVPRVVRPGPNTRYRVALVSERGEVVFETGIADPFELRGEWPASGRAGRIESVHLRKVGRVDFAVRVPFVEAGKLMVFGVPEATPRMERYEPRIFQVVGQGMLPQEVRP